MTEYKTVDGAPDVDALRDEIRHTRAELGETVQALAAKADVKARMKESAAHTRERVRESAAHRAAQVRESLHEATESARRRPAPWLAAAAAAAGVLITLVILRGRRR
jgi:ElaB/YqjD/DUF883 family membrane-anchored ribosome-binding protein